MRLIFLLIFVPLATNAYECGQVKVKSSKKLIIGSGSTYVEPGEWPWLAPLFYNGSYVCSSSLITKRHLLTAAHCFIDHSDPTDYENYFVLLGRHNISDDSESDWVNRTMSAVFIHEGYKDDLKEFKSRNDIAVFEMSQSVEFTDFIQPICLPHPATNTTNVKGFVVGHGFGENDVPEDVAKEAKLTSISAIKCLTMHRDYHKGVSENSFCALSPVAATCNGDSGGGFFINEGRTQSFSTFGVVSQGLGSLKFCQTTDIAVLVDVTSYIDWIYAKVSVCKDNKECESVCELNPCAENADCKAQKSARFTCECKPGYEGDGKSECTPVTKTPRPDFCAAFNCGPNAKCTNFGTFASCSCLGNFIGNPPNCRPGCISDHDCPINRACVNQSCTDLCQSQPCGARVEKCTMMGHERICECSIGQRYDEGLKMCELNPNLIDGEVKAEQCCQWGNDWLITRELTSFVAKRDSKITARDFEVHPQFESSQIEMFIAVACSGCHENIQHLPIKLHKINSDMLVVAVRKTAISRVRRINFEGLQKLQWLALDHNQIRDIDEDAFEDLRSLSFLSLQNNKLEVLNIKIFGNNLKLERLGLAYNQIKSIPPQFFQHVTQLTELHLHNNKLTAIEPKLFGTLVKLRWLYLHGNQLEKLPPGIFEKLSDLELIYLQENQLTTLPLDIFKFNKKLTRANLHKNKISKLDSSVFDGKPDLKYVNLRENVCISKTYDGYGSFSLTTQEQRQELKKDLAAKCEKN